MNGTTDPGELSEERSRHDLFNCELVPSRFGNRKLRLTHPHIVTCDMGSQPFHTELGTDGSASLLLAIQNRHTAVSHPGGSLSQK